MYKLSTLLFLIIICSTRSVYADENAAENLQSDSVQEDPPVQETVTDQRARWDDELVHQLALSEESKQRELVWLDVQYPESEDSYRMLALEKKARVRAVQGAVLFIHDYGHHANWPEVIRPLRHALTMDGWYTLSINMPIPSRSEQLDRDLEVKTADAISLTESLQTNLLKSQTTSMKRASRAQSLDAVDQPSAVSEEADVDVNAVADADAVAEARAEADTDAAAETVTGSEVIDGSELESDSESATVDIDLGRQKPLPYQRWTYAERALAHVNAGFERIKAGGFENVILIAHGAGAQTALEFIQPRADSLNETGFAIVLIDPKLDGAFAEDLGASLGERFKPPVLDLYDHSELEKRSFAEARKVSARLSATRDYMQIKLNGSDLGALEETLLRRIRKWLLVHAPGMEAEKVR